MSATRREVENVPIPVSIRCPISLELMSDPVTLCTGITYDRCTIKKWIDLGNTICPVTKQVMATTELIPNHALRRHIQSWCQTNGLDRIPTPTTPSCPENQEELTAAAIFAESGSGAALEALTAMLPLLGPAQEILLSSESMAKLVAAVENRNSSAVTVLLDLSESEHGEMSYPGVAAALARYISTGLDRAPAPWTALQCLLNVAAKGRTALAEAADAGAVGAVLMFLEASEETRSVEAGMALFQCLMQSAQGRAAAYEHALAVPVVVKKLLRVSNLASESAVVALWRLCVYSLDETILDEVNAMGGFQKLLVWMQLWRSGAKVRRMANGLLRMLHARRAVNQDDCMSRPLAVMSRTLALPFIRRSFG